MINYESFQEGEISISDKLKYLETHSEKILKLFDKNAIYIRNFMEYLISENEIEYLPDSFIEENKPNYDLSLAIIFKVAFFIKNSDYSEKQKEVFKEELRQYVKLLKEPKKKSRTNWSQFLDIDMKSYQNKTKEKRRK